MINFLEKNDECPTCEQQIDKEFKTRSIQVRERDNVELSEGLNKLSDEMNKVNINYLNIKRLQNKFNQMKLRLGKVVVQY